VSALKVQVDGAPLGDDDARSFWKRFSDYMEDHKGDLAGFAKSEGLASVRPEMHQGDAVLVGSRTAAQQAYVSAPTKTRQASSGSSDPRSPSDPPRNAQRSAKKRR
jgi:hypothetical protein